MNSKNEYNRCIIPRLVIDEDESLEEYLEKQRELKVKQEIEKLKVKLRDDRKQPERKRRKTKQIKEITERREKENRKKANSRWTKKKIEKTISNREIRIELNLEKRCREERESKWYRMMMKERLTKKR